MKAALEKKFSDINVEFIESGGGVFEVVHNGKLIFSKKQLGRFPEHSEIIEDLS